MILNTSLLCQDDKPWVLEFPELETINLGDPDVQKTLLSWGLAVSTPNGGIVITKDVKLVALRGGDTYG